MLNNINWILSEENKLQSKSKIEEEKDKESLIINNYDSVIKKVLEVKIL